MLKEIYNEIINSELPILIKNESPISDISGKYGFNQVENNINDEYYRAELLQGEEKISIYIVGSDHSGELQYRKDTIHNIIKYTNKEGSTISEDYMYLADWDSIIVSYHEVQMKRKRIM